MEIVPFYRTMGIYHINDHQIPTSLTYPSYFLPRTKSVIIPLSFQIHRGDLYD